MNILFISMYRFRDITLRGIYTDLVRRMIDKGHHPYIVSPDDDGERQISECEQGKGYTILRVKTNKAQHVSFIRKGMAIVLMPLQMYIAIRKHFRGVRFDLILYATPPITLAGLIWLLKHRTGARTYLMLKDIFPQGAVDLGIMRGGGLLHRFFRAQEKLLYAVSDHIGCMSPANKKYLREHNPSILAEKAELCPNCFEPWERTPIDQEAKTRVRGSYGIPEQAVVFLYGGNIGVPQGVKYIAENLLRCNDCENAFFLIVGSGDAYAELEQVLYQQKSSNVKLLAELPKDEYEALAEACDVGLIFLDPRFTIPNFPSRLLSYMDARIPVFAATDSCTDIGEIIEGGGFGFACRADDPEAFRRIASSFINMRENARLAMGACGRHYFETHYNISVAYNAIFGHMTER